MLVYGSTVVYDDGEALATRCIAKLPHGVGVERTGESRAAHGEVQAGEALVSISSYRLPSHREFWTQWHRSLEFARSGNHRTISAMAGINNTIIHQALYSSIRQSRSPRHRQRGEDDFPASKI
jgi:hypothetical protein